MVWQDLLISFVSILFSLALLPQVYYGFKTKKKSVNIKTSSLTATGLFAVAVAYLSLELYFAAITSLMTGIVWYILLVQGIVYR